MKRETAKVIEEFLAHADDIGDDILEQWEEMLGAVPFILRVMRERPEAFALGALGDYYTCRPESLDPKTAELVTIAAAAAANANKCLGIHINAARNIGASRNEILDTLLIASVVGKTRILADSLRVFREAYETQDTDH